VFLIHNQFPPCGEAMPRQRAAALMLMAVSGKKDVRERTVVQG